MRHNTGTNNKVSLTCTRVLVFGITEHGWQFRCERTPGDRLLSGQVHDHECDLVLGIDESLPGDEPLFNWHEHAMSNCNYGCKVYANWTTGARALVHNSSYGCTITSEEISS